MARASRVVHGLTGRRCGRGNDRCCTWPGRITPRQRGTPTSRAWTWQDSNLRPSPCEGAALPTGPHVQVPSVARLTPARNSLPAVRTGNVRTEGPSLRDSPICLLISRTGAAVTWSPCRLGRRCRGRFRTPSTARLRDGAPSMTTALDIRPAPLRVGGFVEPGQLSLKIADLLAQFACGDLAPMSLRLRFLREVFPDQRACALSQTLIVRVEPARVDGLPLSVLGPELDSAGVPVLDPRIGPPEQIVARRQLVLPQDRTDQDLAGTNPLCQSAIRFRGCFLCRSFRFGRGILCSQGLTERRLDVAVQLGHRTCLSLCAARTSRAASVPGVGFEPTTIRFRGGCSAVELAGLSGAARCRSHARHRYGVPDITKRERST